MWTYGYDLCFGLGGWNWFQDSCLKWSSISPKILNHQLTPPQLLAYQFKRLNHGGKASFANRWDSLKLYNIIYKSWNELSTKGQLFDVSNHLCHPAKRGRAFLTQPASEWKACLWVWLFGKFPRGLRIYQTIWSQFKDQAWTPEVYSSRISETQACVSWSIVNVQQNTSLRYTCKEDVSRSLPCKWCCKEW